VLRRSAADYASGSLCCAWGAEPTGTGRRQLDDGVRCHPDREMKVKVPATFAIVCRPPRLIKGLSPEPLTEPGTSRYAIGSKLLSSNRVPISANRAEEE
jgi:hypothetical protein